MSSIAQSAIAKLKEAGLGDVLHVPGEQAYQAKEGSLAPFSQRLGPWAIVQPRNTEEVSKALKALVSTEGLKFAVRSGGHMWVDNSNNIKDGVTMDLTLLTKRTYNPETKLVSLEPGSRWKDVYRDLVSQGLLVVGGREAEVGVGGFLIGGGISFFIASKGWSCDTIVNYEVVLADGSIVQANKTTNPDLYLALKGGSFNFGIVTRFDMESMEAKKIWCGMAVYPKTASDQVVDAYVDFVNNLAANPDDYAFLYSFHAPLVKDYTISINVSDVNGVANAKPLQKFLTIPNPISKPENFQVKTLYEKLADYVVPSANYTNWEAITVQVDASTMRKAATEYETLIEKLRKAIPDDNFKAQMVTQPILKSWADISAAKGGNVLGIENLPGNCINILIGIEVQSLELRDQVGRPAVKALLSAVKSFAKSINKDADWLYLNYCTDDQEPFATYGAENVKILKAAAAKYDPNRVFQERVPGGFKISKA
ncbi:FAD-binding domain-containing protein [Daldinia decipiens]|uniref:FAD-binding domain-containing protein n=1 Tax=Daldinia decipiens TaxID=326647 RepID=UPI0020C28894|nr:FAD-binding domain-containing protein [Daldinia decipiens]KAI1660214.1 FAD-binding domain-containing protein [Daldinia decipiens]